MLSFGEEEEAFFDTTDELVFDESVVVREDSDYDIWLREPSSVGERRKDFLCRTGFLECSIRGETVEIERADEVSTGMDDDSLLSERRKSNSEANCSVDYSAEGWLDLDAMRLLDVEEVMNVNEKLASIEQCEMDREGLTISKKKKKVMSWWRSFSRRMKRDDANVGSKKSELVAEAGKMARMRVEQSRKRCVECSAVYAGQVVQAHDGLIWTMRFSPDGQYLASGGADGVVCIWRLTMVDASSEAEECCYGGGHDMEGKPVPRNDKSVQAAIIIPEKMFHVEEVPLQRLKGHRADVLDLAWSTSNHLLSSSMDKTIRLWRADSDECLGVFHHSNYVTCVQFNPADESHFISGCIDGKVRIWGIPSKRVEEWANVQDLVTAVCYQPNGRGFVVGSLSGNCRFYESSGDELILNAEISIHGRKKSSGNKITGIQFLNNDSQRVMITSEDSKIRILDGLEVVHKYKGMAKSGSQMAASFTSSGRYIVSIGEDSRVYIWNYDDLSCIQAYKQAKSTRSCESFVCEGASVVLNWSDPVVEENSFACASPTSVLAHDHLEPSPRVWEPERFSLANWFSMDRRSATWPEEKLPSTGGDWQPCGDHFHYQQQRQQKGNGQILSAPWGLTFVTANWDGTIRTFHNYGLPVRI
ncbi:vegetative incompatibility protein HET-E-1-like [Salvia miltiorrhiza]|uniref:vegetative incompatibility protein HET-E-1-like n=1 Tax=Salvia miltiorrhiza TaxID=226208 RepID=UPI0025ABF1B5|nr:vegetative incompatibility protein HET-E-1-like [Salvia miltiorrhiza]